MSLIDKLSSWFGGEPATTPAPTPPADGEGAVWGALAGVLDPELGVDIVSMGLIRALEIDGEALRLTMTLSTEGCPVGPMIQREVEDALRGLGYHPTVTLSFDPPWTPADMTPAARRAVGR